MVEASGCHSPAQDGHSTAVLVLLRNGQSQADTQQVFAGLLDPDLTEIGVGDAHRTAAVLRAADLRIQLIATSPLLRAVRTADVVAEYLGLDGDARSTSWRLAARDLGCLTGMVKRRAMERFGEQQYSRWRYAIDGIPSPAIPTQIEAWRWRPDPRLVNDLPFGEGESLRNVIERVTPLWRDELRPALARGRSVLVVAHGDSLRALRAEIEDPDCDDLSGFEVIPSQPLVYAIDGDGGICRSPRYLGNAVGSSESR